MADFSKALEMARRIAADPNPLSPENEAAVSAMDKEERAFVIGYFHGGTDELNRENQLFAQQEGFNG